MVAESNSPVFNSRKKHRLGNQRWQNDPRADLRMSFGIKAKFDSPLDLLTQGNSLPCRYQVIRYPGTWPGSLAGTQVLVG